MEIRLPHLLHPPVIRALEACPPDKPTRLLSSVPDAPVIFGLKLMLPWGLTTTHIGYLTNAVLDARRSVADYGEPTFQIFLVDEWRKSIEPYQQLALNPVAGRLLFCAVGTNAESALHAIQNAQANWPSASSLFDIDGALIAASNVNAVAVSA